jgi:hypothetical protein
MKVHRSAQCNGLRTLNDQLFRLRRKVIKLSAVVPAVYLHATVLYSRRRHLLGTIVQYCCVESVVMSDFELRINIMEGSVSCPAAASHLFYVETTVDSVRLEVDNTAIVKQVGGRTVWNKRLTKKFTTLERATPTVISMTLYKKKTLLPGFRTVGTAHFALADLVCILDKPAVLTKAPLNTRKRNLSSGYLVLELQLISNDASVQRKAQENHLKKLAILPAPSTQPDNVAHCDGVEAVHKIAVTCKLIELSQLTVLHPASKLFGPDLCSATGMSLLSYVSLVATCFVLITYTTARVLV